MHRRSFITGLVSLVAAPAIVRAASLMPVRSVVMSVAAEGLTIEKLIKAKQLLRGEWSASAMLALPSLMDLNVMVAQMLHVLDISERGQAVMRINSSAPRTR